MLPKFLPLKLILSPLHYAATTGLATKTCSKHNVSEVVIERITVTVYYHLSAISDNVLFILLPLPQGFHTQQPLTGQPLAVVLVL